MVYKACSWLSNLVYQVPRTTIKRVMAGDYAAVTETKPGTVLGAQELLADSYDPKRQFRWILKVDGLPSFAVKSTRRPALSRSSSDQLRAKFFDPVVPSTSESFWKWWKSREKKNASLSLLDPVGIVMEEWKYVGLDLVYVDFGELDYSKADPVEIYFCANYESVEMQDISDARAKKGL